MKTITASLIALLLAGCAYPVSSIGQGTDPGHLRFAGPVGLSVRIDGQERGAVRKNAEPIVIDVVPGRHVAEEIFGGKVVLHREYEVGAGSTIDVKGDNS